MRLLGRFLGRRDISVPFSSEISAYKRLRDRGLLPDGIIDVGAYKGEWTKAALTVWPNRPTLMLEPQAAKRQYLEAVSQELPNVQFQQVLLAAESGREEAFYEMETGSSIYPENSNAPRSKTYLTTTTLDLVAAHLEGNALFVKIDVQGAEIDVLKGAPDTLARATAVQLEVPFMHYNDGAPSLFDIIKFMDEIGFEAVEISNSTILRDIFVQADLVFVKKKSSLLDTVLEF